jgi:hypothetical protein
MSYQNQSISERGQTENRQTNSNLKPLTSQCEIETLASLGNSRFSGVILGYDQAFQAR